MKGGEPAMLYRPHALMLAALAVCLASPGRTDEPKTAEEAIAKYIDALGGRAALAAHNSVRMTGTQTTDAGPPRKATRELKRPNKLRIEDALPNATQTLAFDGQTACATVMANRVAAAFNFFELTGESAKGYRLLADMDGPLVDWRNKGYQIELVGREDVDGRPAYKLKLTYGGASEGGCEYYFLDAESFLPIRVTSMGKGEGGPQPESDTTYGDYRSVDGVMVAHSMRRDSGGPGEGASVEEYTWEKVEFNVDLPDERFARPKSVALDPEPADRPAIENDPAARALYDRMIAALRDDDSLYVECRSRFGSPSYVSGCPYRMWLKKPNYFRVESTLPDGEPAGVLIGDGDNLWIHWPSGRPLFGGEDPSAHEKTKHTSYYAQPAPQGGHSIWHEIVYTGAGLAMVTEPSTFHGYTDCMQEYIDAVAGRGTETIGGELCDVIEVALMDGQRTWKLWLSQRDHLPRKEREVVRVSYNLVHEVTWDKVVLNDEPPADLFVWSPPKDWTQWHPPTAEQQILTAGTPAPEFEGALADGKRVKLSDFRGRVVLLAIWRVG
jgi:outer membrane lipoprotein-sorting protein